MSSFLTILIIFAIILKINMTNVILCAGETAYYSHAVVRLITKNKVVGRSGGSRGVSIRVMKGVRFRVGAYSSKPIRKDVTEQYFGVLTITSKRIIFVTQNKGFCLQLTKLHAIEAFFDGFILYVGEKSYIIQTIYPDVPLKVIELLV